MSLDYLPIFEFVGGRPGVVSGFPDIPYIQYHVQVVVAGVVVTKALLWTDIVTVFGLLVTDFGPGHYDHLNNNHLSAVLIHEEGLQRPKRG